MEVYSGAACVTGHSTSPSKTSSEAAFTVRGRPVRAWLTSLGIDLVPCSAPWWTPWANLYHPPDCIPFGEILSACARERTSSLPCKSHRQASHAGFLHAAFSVLQPSSSCCLQASWPSCDALQDHAGLADLKRCFPCAALDYSHIQEGQAKAVCVEALPHCPQVQGDDSCNLHVHVAWMA